MALALFNANPVHVEIEDVDTILADLQRWEDINDDEDPMPIAFDPAQYGEVIDFATRTRYAALAD
jgi:hypothetical protein